MAKAKFASEHDFESHITVGVKTEDYDPVTGELMPKRTKDSDKDGCDIHNILRRIEQGSLLPDLIRDNPQYGDFSKVGDYRSAMEVVLKAQAQFEALPAAARERFQNDPEAMLAFCADPKNLDEMVKLGLAVGRKVDDKAPGKPGIDSGASQPPAGPGATAPSPGKA